MDVGRQPRGGGLRLGRRRAGTESRTCGSRPGCPRKFSFLGSSASTTAWRAAAVARNALVQMRCLQRGFVFLKVFVEAQRTQQAAAGWGLPAGVGANPQPSAQSNAPWGFYAILRAQRYDIQRGNIPQMSP